MMNKETAAIRLDSIDRVILCGLVVFYLPLIIMKFSIAAVCQMIDTFTFG